MKTSFRLFIGFMFVYGMASGAAFSQVKEDAIAKLKEEHERKISQILIVVPIETLGEIRVAKI